ncbi:MAG: hypothetical protein IIU73_05295 [Selenomonadales bacterium]|nr:hypothetical protein [Selenomonadales bacterium]
MTAVQIIFGIIYTGIGIAALKIMSKNKTAEQKAAIRAANDIATAMATLRDDDLARFNARIKAMQEEIALKDALIEQKDAELARWNILAAATPANGARGIIR